MGTPAYMPPEQASGDPVDERADVYALGAILYHVLAGVPPYLGRSSEQVLEQVLAGPPTPLSRRVPGAPADLLSIVARAMAPEPAERYPTAKQLADELRRFQTGQLVGAHQYSSFALLTRWLRRHRAVVTVSAIALCALVGLGSLSLRSILRARDRATSQRRVATRALTDLNAEQGRRELLDGRALRALVLLAEAYRSGSTSPTLRYLIARAARSIDAQAAVIDEPDARWLGFSPDERTLAILGTQVQLVDADSGATRAVLQGHAEPPHRGAFSPDGTRLATGGVDNTARLWDVASGRALATLEHGNAVLALAFDHTSQRLATAGMDGIIKLWDGHTGAPRGRLVHGRSITQLEFAPGSGRLAALNDGTVRVLDGDGPDATPGRQRSFTGATRILFTSADQLVVGDRDGVVWQWNLADDAVKQRGRHRGGAIVDLVLRGGDIVVSRDLQGGLLMTDASSPAGELFARDQLDTLLSPHGDLAVALEPDSTVRLLDLGNGQAVATLVGQPGRVSAVAMTRGGDRVATAGGGTVRLWRPVRELVLALDERAQSFDASAEHLLLRPGGEPRVLSGGDALQALPGVAHGLAITDSLFVESPRALLLAVIDGALQAFDLTGPAPTSAWSRPGSAGRLLGPAAPSPLFAQLGSDGSLALLRSADGQLLHEFGGGSGSEAGAFEEAGFDATGARLWAQSSQHIVVFDTARFTALATVDEDQASQVALSPDGTQLLATVAGNVTLRRVEAGPAAPVVRRLGANATVTRFSPDGRQVLLAGPGPEVQLVDVASGRTQVTLEGHRGPVYSAGFSPGGERVVTSAGDQTVRVWDSLTGGELWHWSMPSPVVGDVGFSADGDRIWVSSDVGFELWNAAAERRSPAQIAALVEARVPWQIVAGRLVPRGSSGPGPEGGDGGSGAALSATLSFDDISVTGLARRPDLDLPVADGSLEAQVLRAFSSDDLPEAERLLALGPDGGAATSPMLSYLGAWVHLFRDRPAQALSELVAAARLWPSSGSTAMLREVILMATAAGRTTAQTLALLRSLAPGADARLLKLLGDFHAERGDAVREIEVRRIELARVRMSQSTDARLALARALDGIDQPQAAAAERLIAWSAATAPALRARVAADAATVAKLQHVTYLRSGDQAQALAASVQYAMAAATDPPPMPLDQLVGYAGDLAERMAAATGSDARGGADPGASVDRGAQLGSALVRRNLQRRMPSIVTCYETQLMRYPSLEGHLSIDLVVEPDGHVGSLTTLPRAGATGMAGVARCAARELGSLRFPSDGRGRRTLVRLPLVLSPEP